MNWKAFVFTDGTSTSRQRQLWERRYASKFSGVTYRRWIFVDVTGEARTRFVVWWFHAIDNVGWRLIWKWYLDSGAFSIANRHQGRRALLKGPADAALDPSSPIGKDNKITVLWHRLEHISKLLKMPLFSRARPKWFFSRQRHPSSTADHTPEL